MATWITSIYTIDGESIPGGGENAELGTAIFQLWHFDKVLHTVEDGKRTYQYRMTGKVRPVLERMKLEQEKYAHTSLNELFSNLVERLSALDPESELYIELFDS